MDDDDRKTHSLWIAGARQQAEAVERARVAQRDPAGEVLIAPDYFPGYEIQREIHRGAQGAVFRALQKNTGRSVALKLLHDHAFGGVLDKARFEREMRVLAALKHPNIVAIHDGGSHNGRFYLVMDYIAGQPLDVYMASGQRSICETVSLCIQICDAVNAAHVSGIIHRDLKPANVRVDQMGRPFVLDFGLAKLLTTGWNDDGANAGGTLTGQFLGSLPWAAPEQAEGSPSRIDMRTDVYALGVILYYMLTTKFPYSVAGPIKRTLEAIVQHPPVPPRRFRKEINDELETIVLKCLNKERERRYQSAGELAQDLRRYLAGEPIEAKRDSPWYMFRKSALRFRIPLAVVGLFVLLLSISTVVAWTLRNQARDAAIAAGRAEKSAKSSEMLAQTRLRDSLIAQARAIRRTGRAGQRFDALDALTRSAEIEPSREARNEAIAAMALPDVRIQNVLGTGSIGYFDRPLERCAVMEADGALSIVRCADRAEISRIPAPEAGLKEMHWAAFAGSLLTRIFDPLEGYRQLEVWDLAERRIVLRVDDVPDRARFDINSDGNLLAIGRTDQAIHLYDLRTKREVRRVPLDRMPAYVSFDPSGRRLVLYHAAFSAAQVLELESESFQRAFSLEPIGWDVAWGADGDLIAGAAGERIELWDVTRRASRGVLTGHEAQVVRLRFSQDGALLLSYSWDGVVIIWDVRSLRPLLRFSLSQPALSPDARLVAGTFSDKGKSMVGIFELEPALERRRLIGSGKLDVDRVSYGWGLFEPLTGCLITSEANAVTQPALRVFDVFAGRETMQVGGSGGPLALDSVSQSLLIGTAQGVVRRQLHSTGVALKIDAGQIVFPCTRAPTIEIAPACGIALLADCDPNEIALLDLWSASVQPRRLTCRLPSRAKISRDGNWAMTVRFGDVGGEVWDLQRSTKVVQLPQEFAYWPVFHPNGRWLVGGGPMGLRIWEVGTWRELRTIPGSFGSLFFTPDGRLLAVTSEASVRLLDGETFEELALLEPPEHYSTSECAFSADGGLLAQITNRPGVVHLWDLHRVRARLTAMHLDWDSRPAGFRPSPSDN